MAMSIERNDSRLQEIRKNHPEKFASEDRIFGSIEYTTSCGVGICGKCASPSGALTCIDGPFMPLW